MHTKLRVAFVLVAVLAGFLSSLQTAVAQTTQQVCLFSQKNYQGTKYCASTSIGFVPLRFTTASIQIPTGYKVIAYRLPFFIGNTSEQLKSNPNFTDLDGEVRSFRLEKYVPTPPVGQAPNVASLIPILSLLLLDDGYVDPNDFDGDGFPNDVEEIYDTDPRNPNSTPPDIDGDKIPDDVDDDRDGDGVSNVVEEENDTDPNDPDDYPDLVRPELTVDNALDIKTTDAQIAVTGTVNDPLQPDSGVADIFIQSDVYGDTRFTGEYDEVNGSFRIEVPLKLGTNTLVVIAKDNVGNESRLSLTVARGITPIIVQIEPASGTVSVNETVTLRGQVRTNLPVEEFTLVVNDSRVLTTSTNQSDLYDFVFANVPLEIGENRFLFELASDFGGDTQTIDINYLPDSAGTIPKPKITGVSPGNGLTLNQASFRIGAQVQSFAGPLSVSVNGNEVLSSSQGLSFYSVNQLVTFADGQSQISTHLEATDSLGKTTAVTLVHYRDSLGPSIEVDQNFDFHPSVNNVESSPITISGSVTDPNLSSVLVNGQSVILSPSNESNTYLFNVKVAIQGDQPVPVTITAYDRSGNKSVEEYLFKNIARSSITSILPPSNSSYISYNDPITIQVAARLFGQNETDQAYIYLESTGSSSAQLMSIVGTLASGSIQLPPESQDQVIVYELRDQNGGVITQDKTNVSIKSASDVEFQVVRVEPTNNAEYVEPNSVIEVYFNQAVEVDKLDITVKETLNGKTYVNLDPLGEDFIDSKGYVLTNINRNLELVPGQINTLPRKSGVVFAPERLLGYNADVFVTIKYDGKILNRSRFKVRELPTFINGAITDQFGQPLEGVQVSLPELGRTTKTNGDGGYAFGYQEPGDTVIDTGSYQLLVNNDFANPNFGTINTRINIQRNRQNTLASFSLQELDAAIPFYRLQSGSANTLAGGDLTIGLSDAIALFTNSRTSGDVHAQFLPFEHVGVNTYRFAMPHWLFGLQPKGIKVEGNPSLRFKIPKLRNSYDYIDLDNYQYVVLLGYSSEGQVVEPIGVGKIEHLNVVSVGKVHLSSLDYLGYAVVPPKLNSTLEDYSKTRINLQQLKAALQTLSLE
jgi:hypothetical protein